MVQEAWLEPGLVLPRLAAPTVDAVVEAVADALAAAPDDVVPSPNPDDRARIAEAFAAAMAGEGFSVGSGVAIPHIEHRGLDKTRVCLVTLEEPLPARTIDDRPLDLFFFILSKPDPEAHLNLLAHLARLTQSRTLLEGLRRANTREEVAALIRAAEGRHVPAPVAPAAQNAVLLISVCGERAVDALMIHLVDHGVGDACILETQNLREAAAREVPLFSGFRDLFGDPGGRRLFVVETSAEDAETIAAAAARICEEQRAKDARISVLPVTSQWVLAPKVEVPASGGH